MMEQRDNPITPIPETIQYHESNLDHYLSYATTDGQRKEMSLIHAIGNSEPQVAFATFKPGEQEPSAAVILSVEEMRVRKDWLDMLDKLGLLDLS